MANTQNTKALGYAKDLIRINGVMAGQIEQAKTIIAKIALLEIDLGTIDFITEGITHIEQGDVVQFMNNFNSFLTSDLYKDINKVAK